MRHTIPTDNYLQIRDDIRALALETISESAMRLSEADQDKIAVQLTYMHDMEQWLRILIKYDRISIQNAAQILDCLPALALDIL